MIVAALLLIGVGLLLLMKGMGRGRRKGAQRPEAAPSVVVIPGSDRPDRRVRYRFRGSGGAM